MGSFMKMGAEKQKLTLWISCTAVIVAAVFFGMHFYKNGVKTEPQNPFENTVVNLTPQDNGGNIALNDKPDSQSEDNSDESQDESDSNTENDKLDEDKNTNSNPNSKSSSGSNGSSRDNSYADIVGNNEKADYIKDSALKEYFTTSIKDGETVYKKEYSFTITHLNKSLTVKKVEVDVNGIRVNQFSGRCNLSEGKNTIKVSCTYTDSKNAVKRVFKEYTVNCDLGEIVISTDLENKTVEKSVLDFSASAGFEDKNVPLTVEVNGEKISETASGKYSAHLNEGDNIIFLKAKYGQKTKNKKITVKYVPKGLDIDTNLSDKTVNSAELNFWVKLVGAGPNGKINVFLNGEGLNGNNGDYKAVLISGKNNIIIKALYNGKTAEKKFRINYIPVADEETAPQITYINIRDGMNVRGKKCTVELTAKDYKNSRIYSDKINLRVNGQTVGYSAQSNGENGITTYFLNLENGQNSIDIRIFDSEGRFCDYYYTINCSEVGAGEEIGRINISMDADTLGIGEICSDGNFAIYEGESGMDAIKRFLEQNGFTVETVGNGYIKRIYKDGAFVGGQIQQELVNYLIADGVEINNVHSDDSLGEFDYSVGSGWIYSVNGSVPVYGVGDVIFKDTDSVRLAFTVGYGRDIKGAENAYEKVW